MPHNKTKQWIYHIRYVHIWQIKSKITEAWYWVMCGKTTRQNTKLTINQNRDSMLLNNNQQQINSDTARWLLGCQSQCFCTQFYTSAELNTLPLCREQVARTAGPVDKTWTEYFSDQMESRNERCILTSIRCTSHAITCHRLWNRCRHWGMSHASVVSWWTEYVTVALYK